jgi:predicted nucleic acid-binding Zn ribbon protein
MRLPRDWSAPGGVEGPDVRSQPAQAAWHDARRPDGSRDTDTVMKHCPFCAGVIPDGATLCKHCKQAIPSARARDPKAMPLWVMFAIGGALVAVGAPAYLLLRPATKAGAATEEGRRGQLLEGLQAAQGISGQKALCDSPMAVANAWGKLKSVRREDPEWEHATRMADALETCRAGIAKTLATSIGGLRTQQRLDQAENVRRELQTQGFVTTVTLAGGDKEEVVIQSPQFTQSELEKLTTNLSMAAGSFLEAWQKLGSTKVTFTNGKQRWAYELPRTPEAYMDLSVLDGMGIGAPLTLPSAPSAAATTAITPDAPQSH